MTASIQSELEPLLDENECARLLNESPRTTQSRRVRGEGPPYVKNGRSVRYRPSDVRAYIEKNIRRSTSDRGSAV